MKVTGSATSIFRLCNEQMNRSLQGYGVKGATVVLPDLSLNPPCNRLNLFSWETVRLSDKKSALSMAKSDKFHNGIAL